MKKGMKVLSLLVLLLCSAGMVFAGGKADTGKAPEPEKKTETQAPAKKFMAAMATDVGGLGDKSFNDGAYEGLKIANQKDGIEIKVIESKQQTDYVPNLSGLAEDGADIVFAVGFLMADAMVEAAKNNPDTFFAGIDIGLDPTTAPKTRRYSVQGRRVRLSRRCRRRSYDQTIRLGHPQAQRQERCRNGARHARSCG
jgi:basic membrane protein A